AVTRARIGGNEGGEGGGPHLVARVGPPCRTRQLGRARTADRAQGRDGRASHRRRGVLQGGGERCRGAHRGESRQRLRRLGAGQEVVGGGGGPRERGQGARVGRPFGELLDHPFAVPQVEVLPELGREPGRGLVERELLEDRVAVVEHDHRGR